MNLVLLNEVRPYKHVRHFLGDAQGDTHVDELDNYLSKTEGEEHILA